MTIRIYSIILSVCILCFSACATSNTAVAKKMAKKKKKAPVAQQEEYSYTPPSEPTVQYEQPKVAPETSKADTTNTQQLTEPSDFNIKQTKTQQQVIDEYKKEHHGKLPSKTALQKYKITTLNSKKLHVGETSSFLFSHFEIVKLGDESPAIDENLTICLPNGKIFTTKKKSYAQIIDGGGYQIDHSLSIPKGVPLGVYTFKTSIYLKDKLVSKKEIKYNVIP